MIIVTRRKGETLRLCPNEDHPSVEGSPRAPTISGAVVVTVVAVENGKVKLLVTGPDDVSLGPEEHRQPTG